MAKPSLVFLGGKRTAFGSNGGSLRDVNPTDLTLAAARGALEQAGAPAEALDHVILGNVLQSAADSAYTPRHLGLKLGMPIQKPALGVNRLCGSGFQAVVEAYQQMLAGDTQLALAAGVENMSMAPYLLRSVRFGLKMGHSQTTDMLMEALTDSYVQTPMAITAENLAVQYGITREECDRFAFRSQTRYAQARARGVFAEEIAPLPLRDKKGVETPFLLDEHPRSETTLEGLAKLKPVFKKDGVVTAGGASGIVDGAAALVVATEEEASRRGLRPLGRLVSYGIVGCEPKIMGIGPVEASRQALARAGLSLGQMDLVEVNEAFAAQALAVQRELGIGEEVFNVNGGAIAVGHPLGASGTRITLHLLHELKRRGKRYGLGAACIGGGQGIALVVEAY